MGSTSDLSVEPLPPEGAGRLEPLGRAAPVPVRPSWDPSLLPRDPGGVAEEPSGATEVVGPPAPGSALWPAPEGLSEDAGNEDAWPDELILSCGAVSAPEAGLDATMLERGSVEVLMGEGEEVDWP